MADPNAYFVASFTSKAHLLGGGIARKKRTTESYALGMAATGAVLTQTLTRDFGLETMSDSISLTPVASETRVRRRFEATDFSDWVAIQITLADDGVNVGPAGWRLDEWSGLAEVQDGAK